MMGKQTGAAVIVLVGLLAMVTGQAQGAGTASGTPIDNTATINYRVGGVDQDPIDSNTATFLVDNKIDLTVATVDVAAVEVVPGSVDQVLTFTVTNEGNTVQDYSLTAQAAAGTIFGVTDNFDATNVRVFVDADGDSIYTNGVDTATYIDELAPDGAVVVFILANIPLGQVDGDAALYDLIAQTAEGGAAGSQGADILTDDGGVADDPNTVQTVFADDAGTADAQYDGRHSSRDAYHVVTADVSVVKSSAVIDDPVNGVTNPKAIPGATLRYTVTVTNNGSADATSVALVDQIPANTTYATGTITLDGGGLTDIGGDDEGDYNVTNPGAVTVTVATLAMGGGSAVVTFDVNID
jgi:uncharacterized repeat protein (TIGR01451 family)